MSIKTGASINELLWIIMQIHMDKVKSSLIKGAHAVMSDSNLICEKVCIDCTNGDIIELTVNDEDRSVYVTLIMKQKESGSDVCIKGEMVYPINKWVDTLNGPTISAYIAKLIYVVKDVVAKYEDGTLTAMCAISNGLTNNPKLDWCKDATFQMV